MVTVQDGMGASGWGLPPCGAPSPPPEEVGLSITPTSGTGDKARQTRINTSKILSLILVDKVGGQGNFGDKIERIILPLTSETRDKSIRNRIYTGIFCLN